jgi:quercetin dioxygenase-like cupin family protein
MQVEDKSGVIDPAFELCLRSGSIVIGAVASHTRHPDGDRTMAMRDRENATAATAQVVVPCSSLDASIAFFCDRLGFRLDMIAPADRPRIALVSGFGLALRLQACDAEAVRQPLVIRLPVHAQRASAFVARELPGPDGIRMELIDDDARTGIPDGEQVFAINRANDAWGLGRAGMHYRDLIPGRAGGRFIASHIRIPEGGPVPDYVHCHHVRLQLIHCHRGWVRVVYEDQGEPFVMRAGDCVLQPPGIRHRVLEASPGLEVIEIGCPAEHETWRDHDLALPTPQSRPERRFGGQRFVRHVAADAAWKPAPDPRWGYRDTGIADATHGLASVRVLRSREAQGDAKAAAQTREAPVHEGEFLFLFVLAGRCRLRSRAVGDHALAADDACTLPSGADYLLDADSACEILEVALPACCAG